MDTLDLEKKSSAISLSDMEIFVFPELLYSLVLANIMSPRIWLWKEDPWFKDIQKMSPIKRIQRLKQFIMDHYVFNLDLDTWGLTDKDTELSRFSDFIDMDILRSSNALFGYEGDKYYFDIDIRRHFGLDKYNSDTIPYWKTETVEAMDAFKNKEGYSNGAGECVSLSTLYAAALFIIAEIPLEDIFLVATPLHSQNFILESGGIITNNRRIVTKNMWFNGTALSDKARRALENEKVTIVSHISGQLHTMYKDATIDENSYINFSKAIKTFLKTELTYNILGNFLRFRKDVHKCLQVECKIHGQSHYIGLEKLVEYELNYPYMFTDTTRKKLMDKIEISEFHTSKMPGRILLNELEDYIKSKKTDLTNTENMKELEKRFAQDCLSASILINDLKDFCITNPQLPKLEEKNRVSESAISILPGMTRQEISDIIEAQRKTNPTADLAFYAYRDIAKTSPIPFLKAAIERNPVSVSEMQKLSANEIFKKLDDIKNESIYDGISRLAQPDEVWNFSSGDGLEKAILAANVLKNISKKLNIEIIGDCAILRYDDNIHKFKTSKKIPQQIWNLLPEISINKL